MNADWLFGTIKHFVGAIDGKRQTSRTVLLLGGHDSGFVFSNFGRRASARAEEWLHHSPSESSCIIHLKPSQPLFSPRSSNRMLASLGGTCRRNLFMTKSII